jgi:hypothetical protein
MSARKTELALVIFKEINGTFVAQCLTYNFATQADTLPDVLESLARCIRTQTDLSKEAGIEPFSDPAPQKYWDMVQYPKPETEQALQKELETYYKSPTGFTVLRR